MLSEQFRTSVVPGALPGYMCSKPLRWYAVYPQSHFENALAVALVDQGIEIHLPVFTEVHQWKDRKRTVAVPVFPSYSFLRLIDAPAARLQILRTNGALRFLGSDMMAEWVPAEQVEPIQRQLAGTQRGYRQPSLYEGVKVGVRRGPLQDLEESLIRIKNQTRLGVSINLLSQAIANEMDVRDVEPVGILRTQVSTKVTQTGKADVPKS